MSLLYRACLFSILCLPQLIFAQEEGLADFIDQINTPSYDCPDDKHIETVDKYLASNTIDSASRAKLFLHKTHWMICQGKMLEAQKQVQAWLSQDKATNPQSRSYAMAHYQIGFVFDVNEDEQRCDYYQKALDASQNRKDDVYLSATLGLLTVCSYGNQDKAAKLGRLYSLLEEYIPLNNKGAVAHIHNNIGLMYGDLGQNILAAEQYEKAYRIGLAVYDKKNQLATLISAISAYSAAGDYARVDELLSEFKEANREVNTPWSNMVLSYLQARQYYRNADYTGLLEVIPRLEYFLQSSNQVQIAEKLDWYKTMICIYQQQTACVQGFVNEQQGVLAENGWQLYDVDYLKVMVQASLAIQEVDLAGDYFNKYTQLIEKSIQQRQASGQVLGLANLQAQIMQLESSLADAQQRRWDIALWVAVSLLLGGSALFWYLRGIYRKQNERDQLTGLLNRHAAIRAMKKLPIAEANRTNALALFDLHNFQYVNQQYGHVSGDIMLQHVASALKHAVRSVDIVGRVKSKQFVVCMANVEEGIAKQLFERIQQEITSSIVTSSAGERMDVESSMSIYFTSDAFDDIDDLLMDMRASLRGQSNHVAPST